MKKLMTALAAILCFATFAQHIDTTDFESPAARISIDTNLPNNIWQIGTPLKTVFSGAYQGLQAIVTDTARPYADSNLSQFTYRFEVYGSQPYVEFTHRFDTDSNHAGGYIEISIDSGNTWLLLADTTYRMRYYGAYGLQCSNFYTVQDTLPGGKLGFSGTSNGWMTSELSFQCMAIKPPPTGPEQTHHELLLRFTFQSDSMATNKDGWVIDNIVLSNTGGCHSIEEYALTLASIWPNPVSYKHFTISWPGDKYLHNGVLKIYNSMGILILEQPNLQGTSHEMLSDLPAGAYMAVVMENQQPIAMAKLLVE